MLSSEFRSRFVRSAAGVSLVVVAVGLSACATGKSGSGRTGDIITQEEIAKWGPTFSNAYQIVEQLRPNWLLRRGNVHLTPGSGTVDYIVVYEDRNRMGEPDALRRIPAQNVREMQRYTPGEAIQFGPPDHPYGAIVVRTKTGP